MKRRRGHAHSSNAEYCRQLENACATDDNVVPLIERAREARDRVGQEIAALRWPRERSAA